MRRASEYGDYYKHLAEMVLPYLRGDEHICDAGCGLGYLSLELAPRVRQITAVDADADVIGVLQNNLTERGIPNIKALCADVFEAAPEEPYDAMVFSFFGGMEKIAAIAAAQCRGTVFAFKKNYSAHRFSAGSYPVGDDSFASALEWLKTRKIQFRAEEAETESGQPFASLDEARKFFEIYSRDGDKSAIDDDFLAERLVKTGRDDYPLYMPHMRKVGFLMFSADALRSGIDMRE